MSAWDEVRFWAQVIGDSRRTLVCSPELESRLKTSIAVRGLEGIYTVQVSRYVRDDQILVIDEQAISALAAQSSSGGQQPKDSDNE